MQVRPLIDGFSVSPQLSADDIASLAQQGVRGIINNRPDGEAPGQPASAELAAAASAAGIGYRHVPFAGGGIDADVVTDFAQALADMPRPVVAFCRSGTRSTTLWALVAAREGRAVDDILARAAAAGYDLAGLAPWLIAEAPK
ncbi:MAG TPA: TIGR01244 family sulfur transferase [Rhodanobacteraceae bacterium]